MASRYFYSQAEQLRGPVSLHELKELAVSGELRRDAAVWAEHEDQRLAKPALTLIEFPSLQAAAPQAQPLPATKPPKSNARIWAGGAAALIAVAVLAVLYFPKSDVTTATDGASKSTSPQEQLVSDAAGDGDATAPGHKAPHPNAPAPPHGHKMVRPPVAHAPAPGRKNEPAPKADAGSSTEASSEPPRRNGPLVPSGRLPAKDATQYLAKGPLKVTTVDGEGNPPKERILVLLTPDLLVYRDKPGGPTFEVRAGQTARAAQVRLVTPDGKFVWDNKSDDKGKRFDGPTLPVPEQKLDLTPDSEAAFNEVLYLYHLAGLYLERIATAAAANDAKALESLQVDVHRFAQDLRARGHNNDLANLYDELVPVADKLGKLGASRAKLITTITEKKRAELTKARNVILAKASRLDGGYYHGWWWGPSYGPYYGWYGSTGRVDLSPLTGFTSIDASLTRRLNEQMTELLQGQMDPTTRKEFDDIGNGVDKVHRQWLGKYYQMGERTFQIAEKDALKRQRDLDDALHAAKDYAPLQNLLKFRADQDRNPQTRVEQHYVGSLKVIDDQAAKAKELFELAQLCLPAIRQIPPDEIYHPERGRLLAVAADIALRAAAAEAGSLSWKDCYSEKAEFAVLLFDHCLAFSAEGFDRHGDVRQNRAWALFLAGRFKDALQQADEVAGLRKDDALFHYQLARLNAVLDKSKEGLREFDQALELGFDNIAAAKEDADLKRLGSDAFKAMTEVKAEFKFTRGAAKAGSGTVNTNGHMITVTNHSRFALTNVKLHLEVQEAAPKAKTYTTVSYDETNCKKLLLNEKYTWLDAFARNLRDFKGYPMLTLTCDQGTMAAHQVRE